MKRFVHQHGGPFTDTAIGIVPVGRTDKNSSDAAARPGKDATIAVGRAASSKGSCSANTAIRNRLTEQSGDDLVAPPQDTDLFIAFRQKLIVYSLSRRRQIMFAQELPKCPPVFRRCLGRMRDIALMQIEHFLQIVALKLFDRPRFKGAKRIIARPIWENGEFEILAPDFCCL
jgi:hypothetical protein